MNKVSVGYCKTGNKLDKFKSIRPYQDSEIRPVLDQLITDPEFLESIASFYFPKLTRLFPGAYQDGC